MKHGLVTIALAACGAPAVQPPTAAGDDIVALVEGTPIRIADVTTQARAAGTDAHTALTALIDAELLARAAERRGLLDDPAVLEAKRAALARRWLATTFERDVTPADIPLADLRAAFERERPRFDHPELVEVVHILAESSPAAGAARRDALHARAIEVAARATLVKSLDDFRALAVTLSDEAIHLRAEPVTTALRGWTEPAFADAAFALATDGATSPPVETLHGWSVICRVRRAPAEHRSFADAEPELRRALWPEFRARELLRRSDALAAHHAIALHPERLSQVAR